MQVRITVDVRDISTQLNRATSDMQKFGKNMKDVGTTIGKSFGIAGIALSAGLGLAIKKAMDFEQGLANIKAVAPEVGGEMDKVRALALEMGAKTKYSAVEAAGGMEELIKAGVSTKDIFGGALEGALNLATAGELDLSEAAEIASTALNAFKKDGLSVSQAADILAGAANASATDVHELRYGLAMSSAVAAGMGVSFKDVATTLAVFANNGLKGSDAGTSLKTMLMRLQPATKKQAEEFAKLGLLTKDGGSIFYDAAGNMKPMSDVAEILHTKLAGLTSAQRSAALMTLFGSDAVRGATILFNEGADGVNHMNAEMSKTTAADVAKTKLETLSGQLTILKSTFETAAISIGTALMPALSQITGVIQKVVDWFNQLPASMQSSIAIGAAVAAGLLLLTSVVGFLVAGLGMLIAAEWAAILPVVAIVAGVVALIAIFVAAYAKVDWFRNMVNEAFQFIWNVIQAALGAIVGFIREKLTQIQQWWQENGAMIKQAVQNVWSLLGPIINVAMQVILAIIVGTWNAIKNVINGAINIILGIIKFFAALFTGNWGELWEATKQILMGALELVWGLFQLSFGRIFKFFGSWVGSFLSKAGGFVGDLLGKFTGLFPKLLDLAMRGLNAVKNFFDDIFLKIAQMIATKSQGMANTFLNFVTGLQSIFGKVLDIMTSPFKSAWSAIETIIGKIKSAFSSLVLKIPTPKLPHVSVEMKSKSIAGVPIPYPDFSLNWYKTGGIFSGASAIGIGEQPGVKEAAMPLSGKHMQPFAEAVAKWMPEGSGGGPNITIEKMYVRKEQDIEDVAKKLDKLSRKTRRSL